MIIQKMMKNFINEKIRDAQPAKDTEKPRVAAVFDTAISGQRGHRLASELAREQGIETYLFTNQKALVDQIVNDQHQNEKLNGIYLEDWTSETLTQHVDTLCQHAAIDLAIYCPDQPESCGFLELEPNVLRSSWQQTGAAAFYIAQTVVTRMLGYKRGTLIFTGHHSALNATAQHALQAANAASTRMLAQSLAREFAPKGIHVVHLISSESISSSVYWDLHQQHRTAWTQEIVSS